MTREHSLRQVAAVPLRRDDAGELEVLLVTSRETRRWIIPKGWPMRGKADWLAAATEAYEEAGVLGRVAPVPLGTYSYFKRRSKGFRLVDVTVYALEVTACETKFPERNQREARWSRPAEAAELVQEPELKTLLTELETRLNAREAA